MRRRILAVLCWTAAALIGIDVAIGIAARLPSDPRQPGNSVQEYFAYGTSIEAKLKRAAGPDDARAAPLFIAGWVDNECSQPVQRSSGQDVSVYGMSFSNQVADQMTSIRPGLGIVRFAGPAAPPNHSYTCFLRRANLDAEQSRVVLFAVLGSSVKRMASLSGITTSFETPMPFTFPRYKLQAGELVATEPMVRSPDELRRVLANPEAWRAYSESLKNGDFFYDDFITRASPLDHSVTVSLIRRSLSQKLLAKRSQELLGDGTFSGDASLVPALRAMLLDFAVRTRARGAVPVVLLFEDRGTFGVLRRNVVPALQAAQVPHVLSSDVVDTSDPRIFVNDGHFVPDVNRKIAERVLEIAFPQH